MSGTILPYVQIHAKNVNETQDNNKPKLSGSDVVEMQYATDDSKNVPRIKEYTVICQSR